MNATAVVILAAGHGTRMKSAMPKVLHPLAGLPMLAHVIKTANSLSPERLCVVIGDHAPEVGEAAKQHDPDAQIFTQAPPRGTGDAVRCAMPGLEGFEGTVLVLYADTPLIAADTLAAMRDSAEAGAAVSVLGFTPAEPGAYGRLITDAGGALERIVEAKEASAEELAVRLCNSGVMAIDAGVLARELPKIGNDNARGEYYLTDIVALARAAGGTVRVVEGDEREVLGINSRGELAAAEAVWQDRRRRQAMADGVTLSDPDTVYFSHDTVIGRDVSIGQHVVFGPGVQVAEGAQILPFSHLEGAQVSGGAVIGPYARLRPGAMIGASAKIGNFVEIKKADIGDGAKVNHLSYVGDAVVGPGANLGAGTITCNYDGYGKYTTTIGENAFIGSNSALVAPVMIGAGAFVGSGSVVTGDVAPDALALARGRQVEKPGWALSFRKRMTETE